MKRLLPLMVVLGVVLSVGCSALPVTFDAHARGQTVVPKGTAIEQLVGGLGFSQFTALDLSQSQEFKNNNVQKKHVSSASLKSLTLDIKAPEAQNFDFLESIGFYVEAPGQPRKRIATKQVSKGVRSIKCDVDDVDLGPYVRADSMTITTSVKGRRPNADTTVEARLTITVSTVLLRLD